MKMEGKIYWGNPVLTKNMEDLPERECTSETKGMITGRVNEKVQEEIGRILSSDDEGTFFFRSDTGTGKTTGYIKAIAQLVRETDYRFAIAVPTSVDVDEVYGRLVEELGEDKVALWTKKHEEGQDDLTHRCDPRSADLSRYQVFVGTHAFLFNAADKYIGPRDLLIVDEMPQDKTVVEVKLADFSDALETVSDLGLECASWFHQLSQWAHERQEIANGNEIAEWSELCFPIDGSIEAWIELEANSLGPDKETPLGRVLGLLKGYFTRRAFERVKRSARGATLVWVYFQSLKSPIPKQLVFSATPHLDGFQCSPESDRLTQNKGVLANYSNLEVMEVPWPGALRKTPKQIASSQSDTAFALDHIEAILDKTENGAKVLIVVPKPLVGELEERLKQRQETEYVNGREAQSQVSDFCTRTVMVTNYGRDVGSNKFRDCPEVILWANYYKSNHVLFAEWLMYSDQKVTPETLGEVRNGRFSDTLRELQQGQLLATVKQMGCRGTARYVESDGEAKPMRLWISWRDLDLAKLADIFPGCVPAQVDLDDRFKARDTHGVLPRVQKALKSRIEDEVTLVELQNLLGVKNLRGYSNEFEANQVMFAAVGWGFRRGRRGRGSAQSRFIRK